LVQSRLVRVLHHEPTLLPGLDSYVTAWRSWLNHNGKRVRCVLSRLSVFALIFQATLRKIVFRGGSFHFSCLLFQWLLLTWNTTATSNGMFCWALVSVSRLGGGCMAAWPWSFCPLWRSLFGVSWSPTGLGILISRLRFDCLIYV
jgi:hypothetical protein